MDHSPPLILVDPWKAMDMEEWFVGARGNYKADNARVSNRYLSNAPDFRSNFIGFRLCRYSPR